MIITRFFTYFSTTCILITLLGTSTAVFAKRPQPPAPDPEPDPIPIGTTELVSKSSDGIHGAQMIPMPKMTYLFTTARLDLQNASVLQVMEARPMTGVHLHRLARMVVMSRFRLMLTISSKANRHISPRSMCMTG